MNVEEIALRALKKELVRLSAKAKKSKAKYEDCANAASVIIGVRKELAELLKSPGRGSAFMKRLDELEQRETQAFKNSKQDIVKLMNESHEDEISYNEFDRYVQGKEFYLKRRITGQ